MPANSTFLISIYQNIIFGIHFQELSRTILMKDVKGKEAPVIDLSAHVIRYMKDHFLRTLHMRTTVGNEEIHWILPVPAIWKKSAKNFMKEAANKVYIT